MRWFRQNGRKAPISSVNLALLYAKSPVSLQNLVSMQSDEIEFCETRSERNVLMILPLDRKFFVCDDLKGSEIDASILLFALLCFIRVIGHLFSISYNGNLIVRHAHIEHELADFLNAFYG